MSVRILVVDDSAIIRAMLKKAIEMSGVDVGALVEAANGVEALAELEQSWVDIIFTDIHMPEMTGVEFVERLRQDEVLTSIPVVVVSSDRGREMIARLETLGVREYITKPFRPERIHDVIHALLGEVGSGGQDG